jgi:hypothetical protein
MVPTEKRKLVYFEILEEDPVIRYIVEYLLKSESAYSGRSTIHGSL